MQRIRLFSWVIFSLLFSCCLHAAPIAKSILVQNITWTPAPAITHFYVGDTIHFNIQVMPNIKKSDLTFELFAKCNQDAWVPQGEKKEIDSYSFQCAGTSALQINIRHPPTGSVQKVFLSMFQVDPSYVPYDSSFEQKHHALQVMSLKAVYSGKDSPDFDDIKVKLVAGRVIKYIPYKIKFSENQDINFRSSSTKVDFPLVEKFGDWKRLFSATDTYHNYHQQRDFFPYEWAIRMLHNAYVAKNLPKVISEAKTKTASLIAQGNRYATREDNTLFFTYPYSYPLYDHVLNPGWVSGVSQGYALSAFSWVCQVLHNTEACANADKVAHSLMRFQDESKQLHWVSTVDKHNYLWFQEYPVPGNEQFNVLNGHIGAIGGMYSYYLLTHRQDALLFIQASITTVKRYLIDYRMPGTTLNYFKYKNYYVADYSPERTIMLIKWLYNITGDVYFKKLAANMTADSIVSKEFYTLLGET